MISLGPVSQEGFLAWVRAYVGIDALVLPDDAPVIPVAYQVAVDYVSLQLLQAAPNEYLLAVYNLGMSNLINYAPDVQPPVVYKDGLPYFAYFRSKWKINDFVSGVIQSASDEGTSDSLVVPKSLENLTLDDLQHLKDPYGRRYLSLEQKVGTLWGLT
jgi:hypothetical protein